MRRFLISAIAFSAVCGPALALQASDTMASWKRASPQERAALTEKLLGKASAPTRAGIVKCLDEASEIPGHAGLHIGAVAKACQGAGNPAQPV